MMPQITGNYFFPVDQAGKAGAVVEITSGNFVVPTVLYGSDGSTLIGSGNSLSVSLDSVSIMQPVDLQGIYYKDSKGVDSLPIYPSNPTASSSPAYAIPLGGNDTSNNLQLLQLDTNKSLKVLMAGSSSVKGAVTNVTTAGTRVQLSASSYPCTEVTIIAKRTNTGYIYIGGNDVTNDGTIYGAELGAKDSITIRISDLNKIYLNSTVSGDGVSYVAI